MLLNWNYFLVGCQGDVLKRSMKHLNTVKILPEKLDKLFQREDKCQQIPFKRIQYKCNSDNNTRD